MLFVATVANTIDDPLLRNTSASFAAVISPKSPALFVDRPTTDNPAAALFCIFANVTASLSIFAVVTALLAISVVPTESAYNVSATHVVHVDPSYARWNAFCVLVEISVCTTFDPDTVTTNTPGASEPVTHADGIAVATDALMVNRPARR